MTQEFKGTKGPWRVAAKDYNTSKYWIHATDHTSSTKREFQVLYINRGDHPVEEHHDRTMYDAYLIAAAPDLLEALQNLVQLKEWKDRNGKDEHYEKAKNKAWQDAKAAIDKALNQEV